MASDHAPTGGVSKLETISGILVCRHLAYRSEQLRPIGFHTGWPSREPVIPFRDAVGSVCPAKRLSVQGRRCVPPPRRHHHGFFAAL